MAAAKGNKKRSKKNQKKVKNSPEKDTPESPENKQTSPARSISPVSPDPPAPIDVEKPPIAPTALDEIPDLGNSNDNDAQPNRVESPTAAFLKDTEILESPRVPDPSLIVSADSPVAQTGSLLPAFQDSPSQAVPKTAVPQGILAEDPYDEEDDDEDLFHEVQEINNDNAPVIPERSEARGGVEPADDVTLAAATRQPVTFARPVVLDKTEEDLEEPAFDFTESRQNSRESTPHLEQSAPAQPEPEREPEQEPQGKEPQGKESQGKEPQGEPQGESQDKPQEEPQEEELQPEEPDESHIIDGVLSIDADGTQHMQPCAGECKPLPENFDEWEGDFDPDLYFSGPEDMIVTAGVPYSPNIPSPHEEEVPNGERSADTTADLSTQDDSRIHNEMPPEPEPEPEREPEAETVPEREPEPEPEAEPVEPEPVEPELVEEPSEELESQRSQPGMIRRVDGDVLKSPVKHTDSPPKSMQKSLESGPVFEPPSAEPEDASAGTGALGALGGGALGDTVADEEPLHSPRASPRPYKYAQSPLPLSKDFRPEPPIFGVCVVGFHHKRGPEVEYWVGPQESHSNMWPYLPFQSLPDGSHQFEENVCYFTLLYDRNKCASTSLTFLRDEEGHIQEGTSDFRDVTTLFAIACSRQVPLSELDHVGEDEEYTRSVVQKSVVVIASKPIFGPIKEKLTVVTRSFFNQRNFGDKTIINHFYENLVQMPLWANENDHQVGMNLQRCVKDFGNQVLTILKGMLLELKILFYSNDTDALGTTQFALISLVPNLINHLEDCGSPLLSSYELNIRPAQSLNTNDRSSVLNYAGLPLQLFAGGGVFAPFVPLQQFEDLKQPETRYGMFGTANNLFLGNDIDFDMVVNVDTHTIQIKRPELNALLRLSDADRAFSQQITTAVDKAWDSEDRWQPQALGYYGGEDYIRHEFEEYLLGLLASAKLAKSLQTPAQETASSHGSVRSAGADEQDANAVLQPWGKQWTDKWMSSTNNFRIFDKNTDPHLYNIVRAVHPGVKHLKPSGFERFLGFFKAKPPLSPSVRQGSLSPELGASSPASSNLHTPSLDTENRFRFESGLDSPRTPR